MPVTPDTAGPYAPASAIIEIIKRYRNRGLPTPVNGDVLTRAGVSESLIPRTLVALRVLDLIDESGAPTATLEGIRLAPEPEYKQRISDWLRAAYADALQFVDPATATDGQVRDAFRNYKPVGQRERMVSLFTALFREAGIGPERQRAANNAKPVTRTATAKPRAAAPATPRTNSTSTNSSGGGITYGNLPAPIAGMLTSLPMNGAGWSKDTRDRFISTFEVVLDYCIPIVEESEAADTNDASAAA